MAAWAAAALVACDQGRQDDQPVTTGPALAVVSTNIGAGKQLPANGTLQIAFNRLLHPATVIRQSFVVHDTNGNVLEPVVQYDPVARIVSLSSNSATPAQTWLTPGVPYQVDIPVAPAGNFGDGPRAIDGATLGAPVTIDFIATAAVGTGATERPVDFCLDVAPIFQNRCSGGSCHAAPHGSKSPAEGLVLQTADGVANTAIARVSQESNTGARAGLGLPQGPKFGVDMPIVDPNNPGNSWLMYKVLLGRTRPIDQGLDAGASACGSAPLPGPVFQGPTASFDPLGDDEKARLSEFVLGNQMPYPLNLADDQQTPVSAQDDESSTLPVTEDELERLRAWISQGAKTEQCPACPQ
jgi:hypothetical protein